MKRAVYVYVFVILCADYAVSSGDVQNESSGGDVYDVKFAGEDNGRDNGDSASENEENLQERLLKDRYRKLLTILNKYWTQKSPSFYSFKDTTGGDLRDKNGDDQIWNVINARNEILPTDYTSVKESDDKSRFKYLPKTSSSAPIIRDNGASNERYVDEQREFKRFVKEVRDRLPNFKRYGPKIITGTYWQHNFDDDQQNRDNEKPTIKDNGRDYYVKDQDGGESENERKITVNSDDKNESSANDSDYYNDSEDSEDNEDSAESDEDSGDIAWNIPSIINVYNPKVAVINIFEDTPKGGGKIDEKNPSRDTSEKRNDHNEDTKRELFKDNSAQNILFGTNKIDSSLQLSDTNKDTREDCWQFLKRWGRNWRRNRSTTTTTTTTTTTEGNSPQSGDDGETQNNDGPGNNDENVGDNGDDNNGEDNNGDGANGDNNEDNGGGDENDTA